MTATETVKAPANPASPYRVREIRGPIAIINNIEPDENRPRQVYYTVEMMDGVGWCCVFNEDLPFTTGEWWCEFELGIPVRLRSGDFVAEMAKSVNNAES